LLREVLRPEANVPAQESKSRPFEWLIFNL
jgi:hypothetical protein